MACGHWIKLLRQVRDPGALLSVVCGKPLKLRQVVTEDLTEDITKTSIPILFLKRRFSLPNLSP